MAHVKDPESEAIGASPEALHELALQRIKKRRDFYGHLLVFVLFNAAVWVIWALTHSLGEFPWPLVVTLLWGVGLVMNAWDVFFRRPITEAEVQREMRSLQGQH